ncbi:MAG TPA: PH domain-containing protein [Bryobacteraceae bacterium]|nr:PH domain-containing protein [Bryobacteraceae bacterium]
MKSVYAGYLVAIVVAGAAMWAIRQYATDPPGWLYAVPLIVLILPIKAHIARLTVTLRFHDDHLTLETGLFSRTRRTVDTAKIQDVTVQQSFGQRLMGVGSLILEDAGESGGMAMRNIDRPRQIADEIIASSKRPVR